MDYTTSELITGINSITTCSLIGDGSTIATPGTTIDIDEDQRIRARTITVNVT